MNLINDIFSLELIVIILSFELTATPFSRSLGKQRPILSHVAGKSIPEKGQKSCGEGRSATPEPDEAPASGGFVAVSLSPVLQEGDSQEWVMLELEQGGGGGGAPGATRPPDAAPSEEEEQTAEQQEDQGPPVPTSPVLSQMSMPGTWLLGHRRIPGMLGQMPSVIMGRSQSDQVRLITNQGVGGVT